MKDALEKANAVVKQAEKDRVDKCAKIIYDALEKFDCTLQSEFLYRGGRWRDRVLIIAKPENAPPIRVQSSNGDSAE